MRYQDRIYIQTAHSGIRNKDHFNVNMSSDICEFNSPSFIMTGATKIMTGTTINDHNIHIVTGSTFDLSFSFIDNVDTFNNIDTSFKYNIYPYNYNNYVFTTPPIYQSGDIQWNSFNITSGFTDSLLYSNFNIDGEFLVKGNYKYTTCTGFLSAMNDINDTTNPLIGNKYGIYNEEFDNYFALIRKAAKPIFALSPSDSLGLGKLLVETVSIEDEYEVMISSTWLGNPIVSLNGLTMAKGDEEDYTTLNNNIVIFNYPILESDIVTIAYVRDGNPNGLQSESFILVNTIISGATDGEGNNLYYYNTDINKYEIYTQTDPVEFNDIIITLNGITLANGPDYYQSTTNPRRIILNGTIYLGDVITITYNSQGTFVGNINTNNFTIYWTISPTPQAPSIQGHFTTLVAEDNTFNDIIFSATTNYIPNEPLYSTYIDLSTYSGTSAVYKVVNQKDFTLLSGDVITTSTDSDEIPITIII